MKARCIIDSSFKMPEETCGYVCSERTIQIPFVPSIGLQIEIDKTFMEKFEVHEMYWSVAGSEFVLVDKKTFEGQVYRERFLYEYSKRLAESGWESSVDFD